MERKIDLEDLRKDAHNPRVHTERNKAMLKASVEEIGAARSGVVDEDLNILAGNGTFDALQEAGIKTVRLIEPEAGEWVVVQKSGLTAEQKNKYKLLDNRSGELASYDPAELRALNLDLLEYFSPDELETYGAAEDAEDAAGIRAEDDAPLELGDELADKYNTALGQVWALGTHRVFCGDSRTVQIPRRDFPLLIADPPYGMNKDFENDNLHGARLDEFQSAWLDHLEPCLSEHASVYVWGNAEDLWRWWFRSLSNGGADCVTSHVWHFRNEIVWNKQSGFGKLRDDLRSYPNVTERCLFFMRGQGAPWRQYYFDNVTDMLQDVWEDKRPYNDDRWGHQTPKPVEAARRMVQTSCPPDGLVLDPFLGSGTTLMACEERGRTCYGIELAPQFVAVTLERWAKATGQSPRLLAPEEVEDETNRTEAEAHHAQTFGGESGPTPHRTNGGRAGTAPGATEGTEDAHE